MMSTPNDPLATSITLDEGTVVVASRGTQERHPSLLADLSCLDPLSVERLALDRAVRNMDRTASSVVGIGGGRAMDMAKFLAIHNGRPLVLVPTSTASSAPWSEVVALRHRRTCHYVLGAAPAQIIVVEQVLGAAPDILNRAGAGELIATFSALVDLRSTPTSSISSRDDIVEAALMDLHGDLERAADQIGATDLDHSPAVPMVDLLRDLARIRGLAARPQFLDRAAHAFVQAYEHRLGTSPSHGGLLGLGAVVATGLQGGDSERVIDLLARCGVGSHPVDLGLDEPTFNGVLRHAVRYAVGEELPHSIFYTVDLNTSMARRVWSMLWQLPRIVPTRGAR